MASSPGASASAIARSEPRARRNALRWGSSTTTSFNPTISVSGDYAQTNNCPPKLSAGPAAVPGLPHHGHLHPHRHRAQARHPEHRPRGPDDGAHRQRGHHPDSAGAAAVALGGTAESDTEEEGHASHHHEQRRHRGGHRRRQDDHEASSRAAKGPRSRPRLKHLKRLDEKPGRPKINVKLAATDEFGQTATAKIKVEFCHEVTLGECAGYYERQGVMALGAQTATSTTGERVDRVPPDLRLSGAKTQQADGPHRICDMWVCDVIVHVSCGDEECMAHARGRLTKVKHWKLEPDGAPLGLVAPGEELRLGPEMAKDGSASRSARRSTMARTSGRRSPSAPTRRPATWRPRSARSGSSSRNEPGAEAVGLNGRAASAALLVTGCGN